MTQEEFKEVLDEKGYSYKEEGNKIVVNHRDYVDLRSLTTLPKGIAFSNAGSVYLNSLTTLPEGIEFSNMGSVDLGSLTTLPEGTVFPNSGVVYLKSLIGGWFDEWKGNIKGIESKRLLNKMISEGLFNRK